MQHSDGDDGVRLIHSFYFLLFFTSRGVKIDYSVRHVFFVIVPRGLIHSFNLKVIKN